MNNEPFQRPGNDDPLRAEARSLAASVEAIRRACGKTPEWEATCIEFARDLRWALGMSGDDWTDVPSIESQVRRLPR